MRIFHALPEAAGAFCEVFHVKPGSINRGWLGLCAPVVRAPAALGGHRGQGWIRTHFIMVFERFTHPKINGFEVQEPVPPSPSNKVCLKNLCLADSGWGSWDKEIQKIKKYLSLTTQQQVPGFRFRFVFGFHLQLGNHFVLISILAKTGVWGQSPQDGTFGKERIHIISIIWFLDVSGSLFVEGMGFVNRNHLPHGQFSENGPIQCWVHDVSQPTWDIEVHRNKLLETPTWVANRSLTPWHKKNQQPPRVGDSQPRSPPSCSKLLSYACWVSPLRAMPGRDRRGKCWFWAHNISLPLSLSLSYLCVSSFLNIIAPTVFTVYLMWENQWKSWKTHYDFIMVRNITCITCIWTFGYK